MEHWGAHAGPVARLHVAAAGRACRVAPAAALAPCVPRDHPAEGADVTVVGVHLSAVHSAWTERRRGLELRALLADPASARARLSRAGRRLQHARAGRDARPPQAAAAAAALRLAERRPDPLADDPGRPRRRLRRRVPPSPSAEPGYTFPTWDPHLRLDYLFVPAGDIAASPMLGRRARGRREPRRITCRCSWSSRASFRLPASSCPLPAFRGSACKVHGATFRVQRSAFRAWSGSQEQITPALPLSDPLDRMHQHEDVEREIVADRPAHEELHRQREYDNQASREARGEKESERHRQDVRDRVDHAVAEVVERDRGFAVAVDDDRACSRGSPSRPRWSPRSAGACRAASAAPTSHSAP